MRCASFSVCNGTGGVTITRVQTITNYQVNGTPTTGDTTPPTIAVGTTPSTLCISVNASDNNGNSASATATVVVPHDHGH